MARILLVSVCVCNSSFSFGNRRTFLCWSHGTGRNSFSSFFKQMNAHSLEADRKSDYKAYIPDPPILQRWRCFTHLVYENTLTGLEWNMSSQSAMTLLLIVENSDCQLTVENSKGNADFVLIQWLTFILMWWEVICKEGDVRILPEQ